MSGREELLIAGMRRDAMRGAGLDHPLRFLRPAGAKLVRRLPDRANWILTVDGERLYLKTHGPRRFEQPPPGVAEWMNHRMLIEMNIPVPEPVAAGQVADGSSFFCSAAVESGVPLDAWWADAAHRDRAIVRQLASIVRRMHALPVCHRDLYLCHVLFVADRRELVILDWQRLTGEPGGRLRRRWFVKDLAALLHSSRALPGVTRTDRLRFLLGYLGERRVNGAVRRWIARVVAKAGRIARHRPRFDGAGRARSVSR